MFYIVSVLPARLAPAARSINVGAIIGPIIAVLLLLLLLLLLLFFLLARRRRRRRKPKSPEQDNAELEAASSTVSTNLSPSGSSCSRNSDQSTGSAEFTSTTDLDAIVPAAIEKKIPLPPELPEVIMEVSKPEATDKVPDKDPDASTDATVDLGSTLSLPPPVYTSCDNRVHVHENPMPRVDLEPVVLPAVKLRSSLSFNQRPVSIFPEPVAPPPTVPKPLKPTVAKALAEAELATMVSSAPELSVVGPERPRPSGPIGRYVHIPPKLHHQPRGFAPASHATPAPVKSTWGRAKAKMAAEKQQDDEKRESGEGPPSPDAITSTLSLVADDGESQLGSTSQLVV